MFGSVMLENALFGFVCAVRILENYWTEFHQRLNADALWDKDVWDQKVKGQGHSMTKDL